MRLAFVSLVPAQELIAQTILTKGQLQVSDLERQSELESTLAQIATWVANNCVHPTSQRPYTISQIKHALGKQYQVQPHKPIKKQYLDCVKFLKNVIPIERAKMELALSWQLLEHPTDNSTKESPQQQQLDKLVASEESLLLIKQEDNGKTRRSVLLADPSLYRVLDDFAKTLPQGRLEIVRQVVTQEGDIDLEMEIERKNQLQQQQQTNATDIGSDDDYDDDDNAMAILSQKMVQNATIDHGEDDSDDVPGEEEDEEEEENSQIPVNRKQQSKQKKKQSKKAKRRQREEQAEREARAKAEQERQEERRDKIQPIAEAYAPAAATASSGDGFVIKSCNTCGGSFPNAAAYRAHFKSDWHRFNQKLKMQGMPPVSEKEFLLCDAEEFFGSTAE